MPYNFWADGVCLLAERYDTKSNVKLGRFRSQLRASYVSSHTEESWYNETVCLWMTIYIYIYIYIYCHPQTDCFILSELFSVARHAGYSKPGSKPVQLYVRLSFRPLGHQADHVGLGNFWGIYLATAAAAICLHFLYPIGYQSAQFFRRALHYASGGWQFLRQSAQPPWGSVYIVIHRQIFKNTVYSKLLGFWDLKITQVEVNCITIHKTRPKM